MNDEEAARLRAGVSRGDYSAMADLARRLYAAGLGTREVVRGCYGVEFPEEFHAVFEVPADVGLVVNYTYLPWQLLVPPSRGGPALSASLILGDAERRLFARDPDLVPLMSLMAAGTTLKSDIIGYRLSWLRERRTDVWGVADTAEPEDPIVHVGGSLVEVLRRYHAEHLEFYAEIYARPDNRGFGAVRESMVDEARRALARVEAIGRRAAGR
ncbi:hypothetical protein J2S43_002819 [Catenuloplanes nepalensis]|uniref:Uncharacterized protein n=1 Tax=Catenuloplanes nepalensis TaxID=587533 RepID=A0ABT9MS91_9ACTN|nr:hypothetical protein [Catenuloplanes nepalensis]MDP9794307.1 hypothetical protein [Catenuloplanes nepalensis]